MNVFRRLFSQSGAQTGVRDSDAAADSRGTQPGDTLRMSTDRLGDGTTRPLSPEEEAAPAFDLAHLAFGQATDVGVVRKNNQDAALSFLSTSASSDSRPDMGVFVVADGMGGHHDGEIASAIAARTVVAELTRRVYVPLLSRESDAAPITEAITEAIERANEAVVNDVPEGGTTCTAAVVLGDLAYVGHVGDSRAYLIHGGKIDQITRDHSYVQRLFELGQLEDAANHPIKNVLYRALGQGEALEVDVYTKRLPSMSYLLLCSDGLWGQVKEQEMLEIILRHANAQAACAELIMAANRAGGVDNVSAILVQIPR